VKQLKDWSKMEEQKEKNGVGEENERNTTKPEVHM
jgi:hypothetical protein